MDTYFKFKFMSEIIGYAILLIFGMIVLTAGIVDKYKNKRK